MSAGVIKALRKMGFLSRTGDEQVSEKIIEYFHRKFQDEVKIESFNLKDPQRGFENLIDLRKMNIGMKELSGAFHIPKDWVLLERTIILLYGCSSMLTRTSTRWRSSSRTCRSSSSATATGSRSSSRRCVTWRWARSRCRTT